MLSVVDAIGGAGMSQRLPARPHRQQFLAAAVEDLTPTPTLQQDSLSQHPRRETARLFTRPSSGTWSVFDTMSAIAMAGMTLEEHYLKYGIKEGIKGYASGGCTPAGLRLVGENGPELEVTGPSRIWNADTKALLSGGSDGAAIRGPPCATTFGPLDVRWRKTRRIPRN